ncbi:helix-turn-helix domain-containing protein [Methylocystis heyeri]|uniref:Uncharacterized protein n=1 Tax=Methylocystis heyeri TaxID=391905 RepID=A0A6B8KCR8_9HYPH|nr:helix-turn-helix domain-containing protein [Methylocystis heyeri]QGM45477.1 hypothetical protein H2LOC_007085 [Methylocystis heyeri]
MQQDNVKALDIVSRYRSGEPVSALSKTFNVSPQRIYQIIDRETAEEMRSKLPVGALSTRTMKALLHNPVAPVEMSEINPEWVVRNFDRFDLRGIPNLGEKGQKEVIAWVESNGLRLRDRAIVWSRSSRQ